MTPAIVAMALFCKHMSVSELVKELLYLRVFLSKNQKKIVVLLNLRLRNYRRVRFLKASLEFISGQIYQILVELDGRDLDHLI